MKQDGERFAGMVGAGSAGLRGWRVAGGVSVVGLVGFFLLYVLTAGLGQRLALIPGVSIIFWPPAGIFLAALLLNARVMWRWIVVVACVAELTCNGLWFHNPPGFALVYFSANALEALTGAWLIGRFLDRPLRLETLKEVGAFVVLCVVLAPVVGATIIGLTDALRGKHDFLVAWPLVWLGDASGLLVSTPLALVAWQGWRERGRIERRRIAEAVLLGVLLCGLAVLTFRGHMPTVYVLMPPLLWIALRFQIKGAAFAMAFITIAVAALAPGSQVGLAVDDSLVHERVVRLQSFLVISSVSALIVASLSAQHQAIEKRLGLANLELERLVSQRTARVRESEARLKMAARGAGFGIHDLDVASGVATWSEELYDILGVPRTTPIDLNVVLGTIHPDDRPRVEAAMRAALDPAGDGQFEEEFRIVRAADGETRWVYNRCQTTFEEREGVRRAVRNLGVVIDVSARKLGEYERLRLVSIVENSADFIGIADPLGRVLFLNRGGRRMVGLGDEDDVTRTLIKDYFPEGERDRVETEVLPAVATRGKWAGDLNFRHWQTGAAIAVYYDVFRIDDPVSGEPVSYATVTRDMTEQRQAEAALRARERELRSITNNLPNIIARFDRELRHVFVNQAVQKATGLPAEAFIGKTNRELWMPPALCDLWDEAMRRVLETGRSEVLQFSFPGPDGERFYESELVPERDETGAITTLLCINRDVTESARASRDLAVAKEAAESASAAKDRFLAALSHELRTPLAPVKAQVDMWEGQVDLPEGIRDGLAMVRRNIDLECRLIDDMLDLNRISRGKLTMQFARVDVHAELRHAVASVEADATAKQVVLTFDADAAQVEVMADAARLQQVFWNLLKNAVKFTPPGGQIAVRTMNVDEGKVRVEVADTGIGMEPAMLGTVFNAFEQGSAEVTRQFGGLGLGLAISKAVIEMHGGTIEAKSDGRGRGSVFTVELQLAAAAELSAAQRLHPAQGLAFAGTKVEHPIRILLIEDHRDTAMVMSRVLRSLGHEVVWAATVKEALETAMAQTFDVYVSDVGLPDGSGHDFMRELVARVGGEVRAIALTGFGMEEDVRLTKDSGFSAHLTKPVNLEQLETTIQALMKGQGVGG